MSHGYFSNTEDCAMKNLKLVGLKSYDCHIKMQQLQLVTFHGLLSKNV